MQGTRPETSGPTAVEVALDDAVTPPVHVLTCCPEEERERACTVGAVRTGHQRAVRYFSLEYF